MEEVKLSLFLDNIENPKDSTKNTVKTNQCIQ